MKKRTVIKKKKTPLGKSKKQLGQKGSGKARTKTYILVRKLKDLEPMSKCTAQLYKGCMAGRDLDGYFVYGRGRTKSFPSLKSIPKKEIDWAESTM